MISPNFIENIKPWAQRWKRYGVKYGLKYLNDMSEMDLIADAHDSLLNNINNAKSVPLREMYIRFWEKSNTKNVSQ